MMVKEGDKVVPKNVKIGISDGTRTEIISGVTEKSQVVMGSFDFINREASGNAGAAITVATLRLDRRFVFVGGS